MTWPMVKLGEVLTKSEDWIILHPDRKYKEVTVRLWGNGAVLRKEILGAEIASTSRLRVRANQFIISRIDARNGAYGLIPPELDGRSRQHRLPCVRPKSRTSRRQLPALVEPNQAIRGLLYGRQRRDYEPRPAKRGPLSRNRNPPAAVGRAAAVGGPHRRPGREDRRGETTAGTGRDLVTVLGSVCIQRDY